jgi:hypothetical protein
MTARRFPPPWSVDELVERFVVRDATGQALAHAYFEEEPDRRAAAHLFTRDEARRIAAHTYKMRYPQTQQWIPLDTELKEQIEAKLSRTNNCQDYEDRAVILDELRSSEFENCRSEQKDLKEGGFCAPRPSINLYLLLNAGVAVVGFGIVFGLSFLLPAIARRYWRWLNT